MFLFDLSLWHILALVTTLLVSLAFHEAAHALVANQLGDSTAKLNGRLTLNPFAHLDLFGTLAFLFIGVGWGKPVPVSAKNLERPRQDMALIAVAGPFSNLLLAFFSTGALLLIGGYFPPGSFLPIFLSMMIIINCLLALFNLIPVPPLDGGNLLTGILPKHKALYAEDFLETHGFVILFVLIGIDLFFGVPIISGPLFFLAEAISSWFALVWEAIL